MYIIPHTGGCTKSQDNTYQLVDCGQINQMTTKRGGLKMSEIEMTKSRSVRPH